MHRILTCSKSTGKLSQRGALTVTCTWLKTTLGVKSLCQSSASWLEVLPFKFKERLIPALKSGSISNQLLVALQKNSFSNPTHLPGPQMDVDTSVRNQWLILSNLCTLGSRLFHQQLRLRVCFSPHLSLPVWKKAPMYQHLLVLFHHRSQPLICKENEIQVRCGGKSTVIRFFTVSQSEVMANPSAKGLLRAWAGQGP